MSQTSQPHRVLIAGGGPAAIEAALTLQRVAGDRVATTVIAPDPDFVARPMTVLAPFGAGGPERRSLAGLVAEAGATLRSGSLAAVEPEQHRVRTPDGEILEYDSLLLAVGAVPRIPFEHALAFGTRGSEERMHGLIQDLEDGYVRRIAFVVPGDSSWPLPLYELALMTADRGWESNLQPEVTLVTPEDAPLGIFGAEASANVVSMLGAVRIRIVAGARPEVPEAGVVRVEPGGERLHVDRIVTLPLLAGPHIAGLPADAEGFLPVDRSGRVAGVDDVYAAGDATNFAIKQGGIACQQADAAAETIAAVAGADIVPVPFAPILRGVLLTEHQRRFMHRGAGDDASTVTVPPLWWPPTKIAGRELSQHVADIDTRPVPADRAGVEVDLPMRIG
jgi:sulfide:quinone oxidoreductase